MTDLTTKFGEYRNEMSPSLKTVESIIEEIKSKGNPRSREGMSRFGIQIAKAYGVSIPELRRLAKRIGTSHELAQGLWNSEIHEARILAGMIDDPSEVTEDQMEGWVKDFDSWDIVDGVCSSLFDKTRYAVLKAHEWSSRREEYVKRAGFVLMAALAVHDKNAHDRTFLEFLPLIMREATDDRNFVKKAVNWSLRQIGKRNLALNKAAIQTGRKIQTLQSRSANWIAADALRELTSAPVQKRLGKSVKYPRR